MINGANGDQNYQQSVAINAKSIDATIPILNKFEEKDSVPFYRKIVVYFFFIMMLCIGASVVLEELPVLDWDNTKATENPLYVLSNTFQLYISAIEGPNLGQDVQFYNNYSSLMNTTLINRYQAAPTYREALASMYRNLEKDLSQSLTEVLSSSSRGLFAK